jgi:hypothetical protein
MQLPMVVSLEILLGAKFRISNDRQIFSMFRQFC